MSKDFLNIAGKVAIVTGGASGNGKGVSEELAEFGVKVAVCDLQVHAGEETVEKIISNGGIAKYYRCNVANSDEVEATVKKIADDFGSIDILFNNAGIGDKNTNVEDMTDEQWDRMMSVDLNGVFYFSRAVIPYMKKNQWGKIINNSSGSGLIGVEYISHYGAAKAGIIGFTQSIAKEVAKDHINVNVIATPTTVTPQFIEDDYAELPFIPMGRFAYPKDIADLVLFLASDRASYITGQLIAPNGGRRTPI